MFAWNCTTLFVQIQENKSRKGVTSGHLKRSTTTEYSFEFLFALGEVWKLLLDIYDPHPPCSTCTIWVQGPRQISISLVISFQVLSCVPGIILWVWTHQCKIFWTWIRVEHSLRRKSLFFSYFYVILHIQVILRCSKGTMKHYKMEWFLHWPGHEAFAAGH